MRLPTNISFASLPAALVNHLRDSAMLVNRLSDTMPFIRQLASGSSSSIARFLVATATLNFTSIAAGAIGTLTITVTGAAVGDFVLHAPPAAIEAGLMITAYVSAANTVTIRLHNATAGAIDPASAVWGVLVIGVS